VATTTTTTQTTTTTKMSSNKHSGLCSSRAHKTKKTSSKYCKTSSGKFANFTVYSQHVFLDNSFIHNFNGEFNIEKQYQQGELYKTASKTPVKNLLFEKHNGKLKIMETRNPQICNDENIAVYNMSMRNSDAEMEGKYHQWQKIPDTSIILTNDIHSFGSIGGAFDSNCNYSELNSSKINALTPEAFGCFANGGERYVGNLVLNNLGWMNKSGSLIQISSGNNDNVYTKQNNQKLNLVKVTVTSGNRTFKIFTPQISIKRSEMNKNNTSEFNKTHDIQVRDLACTNTVYCFTQMADGYNKQANSTQTLSSTSTSGLPANVNRSPETVVEQTRNDWKQNDKQQIRANKAYLSKIKKNKSLSKYQATVCY